MHLAFLAPTVNAAEAVPIAPIVHANVGRGKSFVVIAVSIRHGFRQAILVRTGRFVREIRNAVSAVVPALTVALSATKSASRRRKVFCFIFFLSFR